MDTTTGVVATGVVVTVGRWAQEKDIGISIFVGMAGVAVFLSVLSASNQKFASQMAILILVSALLIYGPAISKIFGSKK